MAHPGKPLSRAPAEASPLCKDHFWEPLTELTRTRLAEDVRLCLPSPDGHLQCTALGRPGEGAPLRVLAEACRGLAQDSLSKTEQAQHGQQRLVKAASLHALAALSLEHASPQVREWAEEQTFASCWMASFRRAIFRGGEGAKGEGEQGGMEGRSTGRLGSPEGRRADTSTASSPEQRALLIQALGCLEHQAERRQVRRQCAALEGGSSSGSAAARLPPPPSPQGTTAPKGSAPRAAPPFSTSDHDAAGAFSPLPRPRAPPSCMQLNQHWLRGAATLVQPGEQGAGEQRGVLDEANMEALVLHTVLLSSSDPLRHIQQSLKMLSLRTLHMDNGPTRDVASPWKILKALLQHVHRWNHVQCYAEQPEHACLPGQAQGENGDAAGASCRQGQGSRREQHGGGAEAAGPPPQGHLHEAVALLALWCQVALSAIGTGPAASGGASDPSLCERILEAAWMLRDCVMCLVPCLKQNLKSASTALQAFGTSTVGSGPGARVATAASRRSRARGRTKDAEGSVGASAGQHAAQEHCARLEALEKACSTLAVSLGGLSPGIQLALSCERFASGARKVGPALQSLEQLRGLMESFAERCGARRRGLLEGLGLPVAAQEDSLARAGHRGQEILRWFLNGGPDRAREELERLRVQLQWALPCQGQKREREIGAGLNMRWLEAAKRRRISAVDGGQGSAATRSWPRQERVEEVRGWAEAQQREEETGALHRRAWGQETRQHHRTGVGHVSFHSPFQQWSEHQHQHQQEHQHQHQQHQHQQQHQQHQHQQQHHHQQYQHQHQSQHQQHQPVRQYELRKRHCTQQQQQQQALHQQPLPKENRAQPLHQQQQQQQRQRQGEQEAHLPLRQNRDARQATPGAQQQVTPSKGGVSRSSQQALAQPRRTYDLRPRKAAAAPAPPATRSNPAATRPQSGVKLLGPPVILHKEAEEGQGARPKRGEAKGGVQTRRVEPVRLTDVVNKLEVSARTKRRTVEPMQVEGVGARVQPSAGAQKPRVEPTRMQGSGASAGRSGGEQRTRIQPTRLAGGETRPKASTGAERQRSEPLVAGEDARKEANSRGGKKRVQPVRVEGGTGAEAGVGAEKRRSEPLRLASVVARVEARAREQEAKRMSELAARGFQEHEQAHGGDRGRGGGYPVAPAPRRHSRPTPVAPHPHFQAPVAPQSSSGPPQGSRPTAGRPTKAPRGAGGRASAAGPRAAQAAGGVGTPGAPGASGSAVGAFSGSPAYKATPIRITEFVEEREEEAAGARSSPDSEDDTNSHPYSASDLEPSFLPWTDGEESSSEGEVEQGRQGREGGGSGGKRPRPEFIVSSMRLPSSRM